MIRTFSAFLDFCYLAQCNFHTEETLQRLDDAVERFHRYRVIFQTTGVRPTEFSLPRQHSLIHYQHLIRMYGSPNGLCSSITESKHIKAVKEPWRRSNHYEALGQMLLTNQRLDKLATARVDFNSRGMLHGTCLSAAILAGKPYIIQTSIYSTHCPLVQDGGPRHGTPAIVTHDGQLDGFPADADHDADDGDGDDGDDSEVHGSTDLTHVDLAKTLHKRYAVEELAEELNVPDLRILIRRFIYDQLHLDALPLSDVPLSACPSFDGKIARYLSAIATYYAPSDISGIGGMHRERIRATPCWRRGPPRYDCILVNSNPELQGMRGFEIARVFAFLSFDFHDTTYQCALAQWFSHARGGPDTDTGMWLVEPTDEGHTIIHLDCIVRAAHLIPAYGDEFLPPRFHFSNSLDAFFSYYVNKYADHNMFEILS